MRVTNFYRIFSALCFLLTIWLSGTVGIGNVLWLSNFDVTYIELVSFFLLLSAFIFLSFSGSFLDEINIFCQGHVDFCRFEKFLIFGALCVALLGFFKLTAPWIDQDEVEKYGYLTRLIGAGFKVTDQVEVIIGWPVSGEILQAIFYSEKFSVLTIKLVKNVLYLFQFFLVVFISRLLGANLLLSLSSGCLWLVIPEMSYLSVSLKTDSISSFFEITSLFWLTNLLRFGRPGQPAEFAKSEVLVSILLCLWCISALSAVSVRLSSIYIVAVEVFILLISFRACIWASLNFWMRALICGCVLSFIFFFRYALNWYEFGNPVYPLCSSAVVNVFGGSCVEAWFLDAARARYNLYTGFGGFVDFSYLLMYVSLGFNTFFWNWASFLVHPLSKGVAVGWASPLLCLSLVVGLTFSRGKLLVWAAGSFVVFLLWFWGIQYTRALFGLTALSFSVVAAALSPKFDNGSRVVVAITKIVIGFIFLLGLMHHFLYAGFRVAGSMENFSEKGRRSAAVEYYDRLQSTGVSYSPLTVSVERLGLVDSILKEVNPDRVYSNFFGPVHIFFDYPVLSPLFLPRHQPKLIDSMRVCSVEFDSEYEWNVSGLVLETVYLDGEDVQIRCNF